MPLLSHSFKTVKQIGDSQKEQGKKNKLFMVAKNGKVEVKQRGKDGKLRLLNTPGNYGNDTEYEPNGLATSIKYFSPNKLDCISSVGTRGHHPPIGSKRTESQAEDSLQDYVYRLPARDIAAQIDREERALGLAETDISSTGPQGHHPPNGSKGTESDDEDFGEDFVFHLSARDIAAERDRAERELVRIIGTKNALAEKEYAERERRQGLSDHPALPHPGPYHPGPQHLDSPKKLAETERAEIERRRGESNNPTSVYPGYHHPGLHHPDSQRELAETERAETEHRRGESNNPTSIYPGYQHPGSHHPGPQRELGHTDCAERERRRGQSNHPGSQKDLAETEHAKRGHGRDKSNYRISPRPGSHYPGSRHSGSQRELAEAESRRGKSYHSTSPHLGSHDHAGSQTDFAERERRQGQSNHPTSHHPSPRIPVSYIPGVSYHLGPHPPSPRAPKGPHHRPRRGA